MAQTDLSMKQKQTHREDELVVAKAGRVRGGMDWEFGISRCKLLYRMDKQQVPVVYHRGLFLISCDKP